MSAINIHCVSWCSINWACKFALSGSGWRSVLTASTGDHELAQNFRTLHSSQFEPKVTVSIKGSLWLSRFEHNYLAARPFLLQGKKKKRVQQADNHAGLLVTKQGYNCSQWSAKLTKDNQICMLNEMSSAETRTLLYHLTFMLLISFCVGVVTKWSNQRGSDVPACGKGRPERNESKNFLIFMTWPSTHQAAHNSFKVFSLDKHVFTMTNDKKQ